MRITETTEIKVNTIFKDSDGYFIIRDYDKQNDWYIFLQCNRLGKIFDNSEENLHIAKLEDLIDCGAEIIDGQNNKRVYDLMDILPVIPYKK